MLRGTIGKSLDHDPHFRWRGENVTRIENLSDIIFALAMGMLVATPDPLRTFDDLQVFLISAIPVLLGFFILLEIWHNHYTFFRRYGVADKRIIFYNAILLFIVLFLAYPLRLMFDGLFSYFFSFMDDFQRMAEMRMDFDRSGTVVGYFAIGYGLVNVVFMLMYNHVIKNKGLLALSETELTLTYQTRFKQRGAICINIIVGLLSMLTPLNSLASMLYILEAPLSIIARRRFAVAKAE